jgi:ATP-dependent Clp protease ATP-binding subunit ClpA
MRGQDHVVARAAATFNRGELVLPRPDRPLGAFLTVGSTGTGKTELVFLTVRYPGTLIPCDLSVAAICS